MMTDSSKKKKKKSKKKFDDNDHSKVAHTGNGMKMSSDTYKHENNCKKKRKRKKSLEREEMMQSNSEHDVTKSKEMDHSDHVSKKKKKKKKHGEGSTSELEQPENTLKTHKQSELVYNSHKHTKKHKKKKMAEEDEQNEIITLNQGKKHKKKRKHEKIEDSDGDDEDVIPEKSRKSKHGMDKEQTSTPSSEKRHQKKKKKKSKEKTVCSSDENSSMVCETKIKPEGTNSSNSKKSVENNSCVIERKGSGNFMMTTKENFATTSPAVGQWDSAEFESTERQQKFLRLLGGMKKGGNNLAQTTDQKPGKFRLTGVLGGNKALNKDAENELNKKLESQYEAAMSFNLNKIGRSGLGCAIPETVTNKKKSHIDMNKCNSIKFDDSD